MDFKKQQPQQARSSSYPEQNDLRGKRKKRCPYYSSGLREIDYKDVETLLKFVTDRGKILPRRITGVSAYHQKKLSGAIKRARHMALLPFVAES